MICKIICCENLREINSYIAFYYSSIISFFSFVIILVYITLILLEASCFVLFIHFQISFLFTSKYICIFSTSFHFNFYFLYIIIQDSYSYSILLSRSFLSLISFSFMSTFLKIHSWHHQIISLSFIKKSDIDSRKNLVFHKNQ